MATRILFHELNREDLRALAPSATVILPVGATEQHGPHLPVGTDWLTVEHLARGAAARIAAEVPVLVAPTLPFGSSHHHLPFGGTFSLNTETYYRVVFELCEALVIGGFKRIFILNGHGGNNELVQLAARDLALKHPVNCAAASYWVAAWEALSAVHERGGLPGHAGIFETSVVMALRPELVPAQRPHRDGINPAPPAASFYPSVRVERAGFWQSINGHTDSPDLATAAQGQRYIEAAIGAVADAIRAFHQTALV